MMVKSMKQDREGIHLTNSASSQVAGKQLYVYNRSKPSNAGLACAPTCFTKASHTTEENVSHLSPYSTIASHRVCHTHAPLDTFLPSHTTTK